jgi:hypothetical protein
MTKPAAAIARAMDVNTNQHDVTLNAHKVRFDFPFNVRAVMRSPGDIDDLDSNFVRNLFG